MVSLVEALPSEIIVDITSRLAVKSIINCTLVCKFWKTLIPNPFLAKHNPTYFLLYTEESERFSILDFDDDDPTSVSKDQAIIEMKPSFPIYAYDTEYCSQRIHIFGSCNGLVCLSQNVKGATFNIYLYNPVLGQSVTVPKPTLNYSLDTISERYAFGFCPVTNHYKVFRSVYSLYNHNDVVDVEIYTLGSPAWRHIGHVPRKKVWFRSRPICAQGNLHWMWREEDNPKLRSIFTFNLATEEFGWTPPPPTGRGKIMYMLGYMEHCLVATAGPCWDTVSDTDIGMRKESTWDKNWDTDVWMRKESTWNKNWAFRDANIYRARSSLAPVAISADGIILMVDHFGRLYYVDTKDKLATPRVISGYAPCIRSGLVPYDATLVSPWDLMKNVPS